MADERLGSVVVAVQRKNGGEVLEGGVVLRLALTVARVSARHCRQVSAPLISCHKPLITAGYGGVNRRCVLACSRGDLSQ